MKTLMLKIDDSVSENLEENEYINDDTYLRNVEGMTQSILEAKNEPVTNGVTLDKLEW